MDALLSVKLLDHRQIDQAFPVIQSILPELSIERWRAFTAEQMAVAAEATAGVVAQDPGCPPSGIMTVQTRRGYIYGLFSFAVHQHLRHGRVLAVENFVVLDLIDRSPAAAALMQAMDRLAHANRCAAIHTDLPGRFERLPDYCNAVLGYFTQDGHAVETLHLVKLLDRANDNPVGGPLAEDLLAEDLLAEDALAGGTAVRP